MSKLMPVSIPLPWQRCARATEGDFKVRGTALHGLIGGVAALILAATPLGLKVGNALEGGIVVGLADPGARSVIFGEIQ